MNVTLPQKIAIIILIIVNGISFTLNNSAKKEKNRLEEIIQNLEKTIEETDNTENR